MNILHSPAARCIYNLLQTNVNTPAAGPTPKGLHTIVRNNRIPFNHNYGPLGGFCKHCRWWPLFLVTCLISCKTPQVTTTETAHTTLRDSATATMSHDVDDTTTIRHTIINDTLTETKIIRRIHEINEASAQSLQEKDHAAATSTKDTLTPALVNRIIKGLAVACIGLAVVGAGFFLALILIILKLTDRQK